MATTTPNFGWPVPTSTDLVKDGATAIEALGDSIDASLLDLKGGTTGQVLAKNTNTDMDFVWSTPNPGDITAVTAGTGLTGGGTSGAVSLAFDVANYGGGSYAAGKNKIINGDFANWQRGTTLTYTSSGLNYLADRFFSWTIGTLNITVSQQTFTPGTAPVAGYEGQYFLRNAVTSLSGQSIQAVGQRIEDVRTFAGQTATFSFWAKADASRTYTTRIIQNFGSGGSSEVATSGGSHSVTTSWQRFSVTVSIPSVSGKTIGTSSYLMVLLDGPSNTANTLDTWGWQLEAESVATDFQTATGSIQGELAACQRYYFRNANGASTGVFAGGGVAFSTTAGIVPVVMPVPMRVTPTTLDTTGTAANYRLYNGSINSALNAVPTIGAGDSTANLVMLNVAVASGLLAGSNFQLSANSSTTAYLGFGAEL